MKSVYLALFTFLVLAVSAEAHPLRLGRFDTSGIRSEIFDLVGSECDAACKEFAQRAQTADELQLQDWVERFTQNPRNAIFFEGLKFKVSIQEYYSLPEAVAVPNGVVRITQGMIDLFKDNPDLLKAVIAHELAHVARAHYVRVKARAIGDLEIAPVWNGYYVKAPDSVWAVAKEQFLKADSLRMSRAFELEADQIAMETLNNAGMDPVLLPLAVDRMRQLEEGKMREVSSARGVIERAKNRVCGTHPEACTRVSSAFEEIERHGYENAWSAVAKPEGAALRWLKSLVRGGSE